MNIEKKQIDDLNIELSLSITKDDYAPIEKKKLNEQRKKAEFKGFRKGMVPMPMIQHVYGEQVLVDSVNDIIYEQLNKFINDNKLKVLGEPLASENQPENKWEDGNDFTFNFDIALSPELNFEVSKDDKIVYYKIQITDDAKKEMKENFLKQYGSIEEGETAKKDDYIVADFEQEGKKVEGSYVTVANVSEPYQSKFIGAKAGDKFEVNMKEAFANEADVKDILKLKDEAEMTNPVFSMTITKVRTFVPAVESQETYDKIFGKDKVKSAEDFDKAIEEQLENNYKQEADYRFSVDAKNYFVNKAAIALPEAFLQRWLHNMNKDKFSMEDIAKEMPAFLEDYRWQMVREYVMDKFNLKVEKADMQEAAFAYVHYQYAMYGMANVPEQLLHEAAEKMLSDEQQSRRILDQVQGQKVTKAFLDTVTLENKKISVEKFRELK